MVFLTLALTLSCASPAPPQEAAFEAPSSAALVALLEGGENRLPLDFAMRVTSRLALWEHRSSSLAPAFFIPFPSQEEESAESTTPPPSRASAEDFALLAGVNFPEGAEGILLLHGPSFSADSVSSADGSLTGAWKRLEELPVDSTEYLFNALLQAYLRLDVLGEPSSPLAREIQARAAVRMAELPESIPAEARQEAYIEALAGFGSHALAVANEIHRAAARFAARDGNLCTALERPGTLFALWPQIFEKGQYTGRLYRPGQGEGQGGRWIDLHIALEPEDKAFFLREILEGAWGEPPEEAMRRRYCGEDATP